MNRIKALAKTILIASLLINSVAAEARGGHGYGHRGGYGVHYSHHGHGDAAGYLILGLIGGALLTSILHQSHYDHERDYRYQELPRRQPYGKTRYQQPGQEMYLPQQREVLPRYDEYEGWDWLERGYADKAMDIFAAQSQRNLAAGTPRIGFALAAASKGELDRGNLAMRKALRVEPDSLRYINITRELQPTLNSIFREYQSLVAGQRDRHSGADDAFMFASIAYLKGEYQLADQVLSDTIANGDYSESSRNLKQLLEKELYRG